MLIVSNDTRKMKEVVLKITTSFEIGVHTAVNKFLGMGVENHIDRLTLHSKPLIDHLLEASNMHNCKSSSTPLPSGTVFQTNENISCSEAWQSGYHQIVGSLLHLANATRPDIAYTASYLSKFLECPTEVHCKASKHALRYLKATQTHGITYRREDVPGLHGYTDSDFASDVKDRKSISGFKFKLAGGAISWGSKKQDTVAQ